MKRLLILVTTLALTASAHAICCDSDDVTATSLLLNGVASGASGNAGSPIDVTLTAEQTGAGTAACGTYGFTTTVYVVDPAGNTESTVSMASSVSCLNSATVHLTITAAAGGTYTIRVQSVGATDSVPGNGWLSQTIAVTGPAPTPTSVAGSLPAELAGEKLVLAPNPAGKGGKVRPYLDRPAKWVKISIFDIQGGKVAEAENYWEVNVAPGVYLMRVEAGFADGGTQTWTKKVAIK
jgi:hypothetical protein